MITAHLINSGDGEDDNITSGDGEDTNNGDNWSGYGNGGNDVINSGADDDENYGDSKGDANMPLGFSGGNDIINSGDGNDINCADHGKGTGTNGPVSIGFSLFGVFPILVNDIINSGAGDDENYGDICTPTPEPGLAGVLPGGNDLIISGAGDDQNYGGGGADFIWNSMGTDLIYHADAATGSGPDVLW
jgi:hypothetical protein